jgi:hypothetical protein
MPNRHFGTSFYDVNGWLEKENRDGNATLAPGLQRVFAYNKRTHVFEITTVPEGWFRGREEWEPHLFDVISSPLLLYRLCCLFPLEVRLGVLPAAELCKSSTGSQGLLHC